MRFIMKSALLISATLAAFSTQAEIYNIKNLKTIVNSSSCIIVPARGTSEVRMRVNLNASDNPVCVPFNPNVSGSWNYHITSMIYDSLGFSYKLAIYFAKQQVNQWQVYAYVNGKSVGVGKFVFDGTGTLTSVTGLSHLQWFPTSDEIVPQVFSIDPTCTTQLGNSYDNEIWNDGKSAGENFHAMLSQSVAKNERRANSCIIVPARATSLIKINDNLNASDPVPYVSTFNFADSRTYNYAHAISIYDSLGVSHQAVLYYVKLFANDLDVHVYIDGESVGVGHIIFNPSGNLVSATGLTNLVWIPTSGAVSPQRFSIDMTCSTQFGSKDDINEVPWQDGQAPGLSLCLG